MATLSLNPNQILMIKTVAVRERPFAKRISITLAFRLLGITSPGLDVFAVLDELDYLEGIGPSSKTKTEAPFRHAPLTSFWHKHFAAARHIIPNIGVRWGMKNGGNRELREMIEEIARTHGDDSEEWPKRLAHVFTVGAIEDRARRGLTSDWIIYAKHEGKNYYLDLADHQEGESANTPKLLLKIRNGCEVEFPFLFQAADNDPQKGLPT